MSLGTIRCILHTHETGTDVVDAVCWVLDVLVANQKTIWNATSFVRLLEVKMVESLLGKSRRLEVALFLLYTGRE